MKKTNKFLLLALTGLLVVTPTATVFADDDVAPEKVTKIVSTDKNLTVGEEFKLKATVTPVDADDDGLRWKIVGKKGIVRFDDDDDSDDEVELKAIKAGTTKVRCSIIGKGKKFSKTITLKVKKAKKVKTPKDFKKNVKTEVWDDFDLELNNNFKGAPSDLEWSIADSNIVEFKLDDDDEREAEFRAKNVGKTTVTCRNKRTGQKMQFIVEVVPNDDAYDDDRDDD